MIKNFIEVKRFVGKIPAIAYTDFRFVYLSWSLQNDEYDLAYLHECSHIWLQHQYRQTQLIESEGDTFNHNCWLLATDLEIAKHLYSANDTLIIERPRSELAGGITYEKTLEYPNCIYAEDFYHELKKQKEQQKSTCCQCKPTTKTKGKQTETTETTDTLIEQAKNKLKALNKSKKSKDVQKKLDNFKAPKPSLASEIDKHLGRTKIKRVASYKRPSRRESLNDLLKKGVANKFQTPHLTLYVDRSGSFDQTKTARATSLISNIMTKYRGRITQDVLYFNDKLMVVDPKQGSGGTNYTAVVEHIIKEKAKLAIVLTDDDSYSKPANLEKLPPTIVVPVGTASTVLARELGLIEV